MCPVQHRKQRRPCKYRHFHTQQIPTPARLSAVEVLNCCKSQCNRHARGGRLRHVGALLLLRSCAALRRPIARRAVLCRSPRNAPCCAFTAAAYAQPPNYLTSKLRGSSIQLASFFCVTMAFFYVSAHTLHSLGQVTVTVRRLRKRT